MDIVDRARELASMAHAAQVDKIGTPYIEHPARVAERVLAAGGGQDTDVTLDEIDRAFGPRIAGAVDAISRRHGEGDDYYRRVAANPIARLVKVHDIVDNTAPERAAKLDSATTARLSAKYAHARELLAIAVDPN